jgi:hypothetical protein
MVLKIIAGLAAGLLAYFLITLAIIKFYPDDPSQMSWHIREAFNAKYIQNLKPEETILQQQVIDRLGGPDITRAYRHEGKVYQLLYYRTHRAIADGITTEDECTPLLFIERKLVAIGHDAIERYEQHSPANH